MFRILYSEKKRPGYPLQKRLGGHQNQSGGAAERDKYPDPFKNQTLFLSCPNCSLLTLSTEPPRLQI